MLRKKERKTETTVIGSYCCVQSSKIDSAGDIVIYGAVEGNVYCKLELTIGEGGSLTGDVESGRILVSGKFKGHIIADVLHITETGNVSGDVVCNHLIIDEGAVFNGTTKMLSEKDKTEIVERDGE